ncbi:MAG TPA: C40 family peptidase [Mycobacteriales bacterium]|jgi:cell wall-associated NlpC family hydrolase|nr:C40 family peptidase [Mycobacteriales bacterium]
MSRFRLPRWLVAPLLIVLTTANFATATTTLVVRHLENPAAASATGAVGPLPPAPAGAVDPVQAPFSVNTPGAVKRHHGRHLVSATLLVTSDHPLSDKAVRRLARLSGVHRVEPVSAGHARVMGHKAFVLGVNPTTFRPFTPASTAASNELWRSIAGGDVAVSFDMGQNANLPLGGTVPVADTRGVAPMRIGAFASVGMAGVDAVFSGERAQQIGLVPRTGVVISAPKADPLQLRKTALSVLRHKAHAELLRDVVIVRDEGEFLTRDQIANFLNAAKSRIGLPYVWGAAGPAAFDCSGLVQWAFRYAGVSMPRVSEEQWFTGPRVPYSDARPGDLLFWHYDPKDPSDIDHVAIYVGNGMMIAAPHTGDFVKYEPVPLSNMAGVVRVDPRLAAELAY